MSGDADERSHIILFDGVCVSARAGSASSPRATAAVVFVSSPSNGRKAARWPARFGIDPDNPDTFILIAGGRPYFRSDAALRILAALPRWRWTGVFRAIPASPRDALYNVIARNRYRWFGRRDACVLPQASGNCYHERK